MKTTIDLDEAKLERVMRLTGLATRKEAIDFALTEAERSARVRAILNQPFFKGVGETSPIVDPKYDIGAMRNADRPVQP